jgi:hypothetical protein
MAVLTLSHRANSDHTADDFAVGQRVKAHPATDTFMRGDVYGTIGVADQSSWCWSRWIAVAGVCALRRAIFSTLTNRPHQTQRGCIRVGPYAASNPNHWRVELDQ